MVGLLTGKSQIPAISADLEWAVIDVAAVEILRGAMRRHRAGWEGMDQRVVPLMMLPADEAARSLDVLA